MYKFYQFHIMVIVYSEYVFLNVSNVSASCWATQPRSPSTLPRLPRCSLRSGNSSPVSYLIQSWRPCLLLRHSTPGGQGITSGYMDILNIIKYNKYN